MKKNQRKAKLILSISSDIGFHLAKDWLKKGYNVIGTYRQFSQNCRKLESLGATILKCDLTNDASVECAANKILTHSDWIHLVLAAGTQEPIGKFSEINFLNWKESFNINFLNQLYFLQLLIKNLRFSEFKNKRVIMFAGSGTNSAPLNYSAYTISKIALIKMCELLQAEIPQVSFTILGPGWVKTKIHNETIRSSYLAGNNLKIAKTKIKNNDFYPMEKVIQCCNWILSAKKEVVNGRNFSAVFDPWEEKKIDQISKDNNNFKLRRFSNDFFE